MHQRIAWQHAWRQPVAQVLPYLWVARLHNATLINPGLHPLDVAAHCVVVLLQHLHIAVVTIELPRHNLDGCTPAYAAATTWLPRRTVRYIAVSHLRTADVAEPLVVEGLRREVVHHGNARHLTVARICRALAVRAVTGDRAVHIVELAALPNLVNLVNQFVRGLKLARTFHSGVHCMSLNLLCREVVDTRNLYLRKYKPSESGVVRLVTRALGNIDVVTVAWRLTQILD